MGLGEVAPDGACMFRAISVHLYGDDEFHGTVRAACLEYMQIRRAHFEPFVDDGEGTFDEYMHRMTADSSWGGQPELQAACLLYDRAAVLFGYDQVSGARLQRTLHEQAKGGDLAKAFALSYFSGNHYDAVVPRARMIMGDGGGGQEEEWVGVRAFLKTRPGVFEQNCLHQVRKNVAAGKKWGADDKISREMYEHDNRKQSIEHQLRVPSYPPSHATAPSHDPWQQQRHMPHRPLPKGWMPQPGDRVLYTPNGKECRVLRMSRGIGSFSVVYSIQEVGDVSLRPSPRRGECPRLAATAAQPNRSPQPGAGINAALGSAFNTGGQSNLPDEWARGAAGGAAGGRVVGGGKRRATGAANEGPNVGDEVVRKGEVCRVVHIERSIVPNAYTVALPDGREVGTELTRLFKVGGGRWGGDDEDGNGGPRIRDNVPLRDLSPLHSHRPPVARIPLAPPGPLPTPPPKRQRGEEMRVPSLNSNRGIEGRWAVYVSGTADTM